MQGVAFFEFVEQGCLVDLLELFNFLKMLKLKRFLGKGDSDGEEETPKIKLISYECIQTICYHIRLVLTYFVNCQQILMTFTKPTIMDLIKEDGVYESVQEYYVNYIFRLVSVLTSREKKSSKKKSKSEDEGQNLGSSLIDDSPQKSSPIKDESDAKQSNDTMLKNLKSSSGEFEGSEHFKPLFEKLSLTAQLYENRDLR